MINNKYNNMVLSPVVNDFANKRNRIGNLFFLNCKYFVELTNSNYLYYPNVLLQDSSPLL